ncbi:MAG: helix-turn-helix domain-containing protein [Alkaliphilus sp.]
MVGYKIRKRRISIGITQTLLAERVGVDNSTICKIENEQANPSLDTLYKISKALQIDIKLLLENENN